MKKLIAVFSLLTILLSLVPTSIQAAENRGTIFSDVAPLHYYTEATEALSRTGIVSGYPDGTYKPKNSITRAEMAVIICRAIGKEAEATQTFGKTLFDDVSKSHWASGYINLAAKKGIINGDGNGKFRPEDNVKHEEAIKMIVCALNFDYNLETDSKNWASGYIKIAQNRGITKNSQGVEGKSSTRGDIAVMLYGALASDLPIPEASLNSGDYTGEQEVFLSTPTSGAEIYYTLDGTFPDLDGTKYINGITIDHSCTLQAVTVKNGIIGSNAMFEAYNIHPKTYLLTAGESEHGRIIASFGEYEEYSNIDLEAVPDDGYEFERWYSDNGGTFLGDYYSPEITFQMPGDDVVISASFVKTTSEEIDTSNDADDNSDVEKEYSDNYSEPEDTASVSSVPVYDNSVVPQYDYVTGAQKSVNLYGETVSPIGFTQSNADITRYFYDSNEEQVEVYKEYLLSAGWTYNKTLKSGDTRGTSVVTGFYHTDDNGDMDAQVAIHFFPDCGDVDLEVVLKIR